jgi:hypothetical protein
MISRNQQEIADALLGVAPTADFLRKEPQKRGYTPLSNQVHKSPKNKNAVSIHENYVSFMVPNWLLDTEARALNLTTRCDTNLGKRLHILHLTTVQIKSNASYFSKLLQIAKEESRGRQTLGTKRPR